MGFFFMGADYRAGRDDKSIGNGDWLEVPHTHWGGRAGERTPDTDLKYSENWRVWRTGERELLEDSEVENDASGPRLRNKRASPASQARNQERLADGLGGDFAGEKLFPSTRQIVHEGR